MFNKKTSYLSLVMRCFKRYKTLEYFKFMLLKYGYYSKEIDIGRAFNINLQIDGMTKNSEFR
jgi:hypothetical protein